MVLSLDTEGTDHRHGFEDPHHRRRQRRRVSGNTVNMSPMVAMRVSGIPAKSAVYKRFETLAAEEGCTCSPPTRRLQHLRIHRALHRRRVAGHLSRTRRGRFRRLRDGDLCRWHDGDGLRAPDAAHGPDRPLRDERVDRRHLGQQLRAVQTRLPGPDPRRLDAGPIRGGGREHLRGVGGHASHRRGHRHDEQDPHRHRADTGRGRHLRHRVRRPAGRRRCDRARLPLGQPGLHGRHLPHGHHLQRHRWGEQQDHHALEPVE